MKTKKYSSSKINQLVLRGLIAEDQELFLQRLGIMIDRSSFEFLEQLAEGIIIDARVTDEEAAKAWIMSRNNCRKWTTVEILNVEPTSDSDCVRINYKYTISKWFDTEKKADRYSDGYSEEGVAQMDEEHQYEGSYSSTSNDTCRTDKEWLEIEKL